MSRIVTTFYRPEFSRLPDTFNGFRIAQVSDLHNRCFRGALGKSAAAAKPDVIVITGDMIHTDGDCVHALAAAAELVSVAPTYYVNGNHESVLACYGDFTEKLRETGIKILNSEVEYIVRGEEKIALIGMSDPTFFTAPEGGVKKDAFKQTLKDITQNLGENMFKVALSHRPELFPFYVSLGIDLTLTGHAHGGQVRFPFLGALYAPNQGLFPRYADGMKNSGEKYVVISRGLGKSNPVPRIFNAPELVCVTLGKA